MVGWFSNELILARICCDRYYKVSLASVRVILRRNSFFKVTSFFPIALFSVLSFLLCVESFSQTADQIQQLNSLPPAQREALMQQLGLGTQLQPGQAGAEPLNFPDVVNPLPEDGMGELGEDFNTVPVLEPGDTIVVEFVLRPSDWVPPPPSPNTNQLTQPQQAYASTAGANNVLAVGPELSIGGGEAEPIILDPETILQRELMYDRLVSGNPYQLDAQGFLNLPGVPPIRLAGLNVEEAMIRVRVEPSLVWLSPIVTFLPLEPFGLDLLEPFGYELFRGVPTTFAPATDVPVPSEYVIGPGDTVNVLLFGNTNAQYQLVVSREGVINFPEIGPIAVAGLSFEDLQTAITQRVAEQMIGVRSNVTLGELRSIRVFVLGDVQQPGSYTVSGLSTMTNALFVSGGVSDVGSLRQIELRRGGQIVSTLDLYDLLLRGDTSNDERLQPGDVIFAPPIGESVSIHGEIRRPAIYELNGEDSIEEVISLSGGLRSNADISGVRLERFMPSGTTAYNFDLSSSTQDLESLMDGDVLFVPPRVDQLDRAVRLVGNVYQPGLYPWKEGLTLTELISSRELVMPGSDLGYILIRREIEPNVLTEVLSADLQAAWDDPGDESNIILHSGDTVHVFDQLSGRERVIPALLDELKVQRGQQGETALVRIGGQVNSPGDYPLERDMTVLDLIRAGGGLTEAAYDLDAELVRYNTFNGSNRQTEVLVVNLAETLSGSGATNFTLSSYDYLNIKVIPNWSTQETVEIVGEVTFPGIYPLTEGETLADVIDRAGGLTGYAFPEGSLFVREELLEREANQLQNLANRIEGDLQSLAGDPANAQAVVAGQALVNRLRNTQPVGRLVIDIPAIIEGDTTQNIVLRSNDRIFIPPVSQEVTVLGEVQYPTSHVFSAGLDRDGYIAMSGGTTDNSDIARIYTVHASGRVDISTGSRWFMNERQSEILPGDTIVVPVDTSTPLIPVWAAATQVVYNIAIAAAALNSF